MRLGQGNRFAWIGAASLALVISLASSATAQQGNPPLPPPRPDGPAVRAPEPSEADRTAAPRPPEQMQDAGKNAETCQDRISRLGVRFAPRPVVQEDSCNVQDPVLVSELPGGVMVSPASLMTCPIAESLARWFQDVLEPEADRHFQTAPTKLFIGTSYQCRNQRSGEKLSEHAFGNAVDIMGFAFAKRESLTIGFQAEGSPEGLFQNAVQKGACPIFTTVLGPGADGDHGNHLHLDMRARKGDYRICQ